MLFHRQHVIEVSSRRAIVIDALTNSHLCRTVAAAPHGAMRLPARAYLENAALTSERRLMDFSTSAADTVDECRKFSNLRCAKQIKFLPALILL
jgi:hypothetical protein